MMEEEVKETSHHHHNGIISLLFFVATRVLKNAFLIDLSEEKNYGF